MTRHDGPPAPVHARLQVDLMGRDHRATAGCWCQPRQAIDLATGGPVYVHGLTPDHIRPGAAASTGRHRGRVGCPRATAPQPKHPGTERNGTAGARTASSAARGSTSREAAQAIIDDPTATPDAKEGARAWLALRH